MHSTNIVSHHEVQILTVERNSHNADLLCLDVTETPCDGHANHFGLAMDRELWQQTVDQLAANGVLPRLFGGGA